MYTIHHSESTQLLQIKNTKNRVHAQIHLNQGASLQKLTIGTHAIIQDLSPLGYANTYASSILFPFANRIKDGSYTFATKTYQFDKNIEAEQNALHGLVFNKTFKVLHTEATAKFAKVTLEYNEAHPPPAFPYAYKVKLEYHIEASSLSLKMSITNKSHATFPFTLGWHPYFATTNLSESTVRFDSRSKMLLDDRNITIGTSHTEGQTVLDIKDQKFDDCWALATDTVLFKTPEYTLQFNASGTNNFLQIYTPPKPNVIAIEQTTGVSDSFNNAIGLDTLNPGATHSITWDLSIKNKQ